MENHYSNTNTKKESSIIFGQNIIPNNTPFITNTIPNNNEVYFTYSRQLMMNITLLITLSKRPRKKLIQLVFY